ncbi:bifunctional pyr operon transcriptional regulator/uracil phosphoribosyltransferase PyrR [Fannyhessea vaginae]|uniref:bifunctional pyr operon transcriptional regulator/uracil phosphoribosyltransferase PyrR n=2 Tax=Fannyhessea vaginae TaxID=82135 RepID=UPI0037C166E7
MYALKRTGRRAMQPKLKASIMDATAMQRALVRIAHEIIERNEGSDVVLIGIIRRGATLAKRLASQIEAIQGTRPRTGELDISFYRDDVNRSIVPVLHATNIPFKIDKQRIILVDDVLFTGRTIRSALNALMDYGRPDSVQLAVMVDRGHRELPIRADFVGKNVPSSHDEDVRVLVNEYDKEDAVEIWTSDSQHKESEC